MSIWLALTIALAVCAWLAAWSRYPSRSRWLAVVAFIVASPVSGAALFAVLGWPVPLYPYVSAPAGEPAVLGVKMVPDVAIYVMLDGPEPRLYELPWNAEQASRLQRMLEGGQGGGDIRMRRQGAFARGEFYLDGAPPQMLPEKPPEPPRMIYERR